MVFRTLKTLFGWLLALLAFIYLISPVVWKYSPFVQRNLLFMNHVNTQYNFNLSHPEQLGLKCTRTLRLDHTSKSGLKIELGVWHILPGSSLHNCETTAFNDNNSNKDLANNINHNQSRTSIADGIAFADSRPIVLYLHGNGGTRAGDHRNQLYQKLAYGFDYHIVTFDYRGYGDSTYVQPTTDGLSADAQFMYRWLLDHPNVNKDRVLVWGHSLGTAVAVRMVSSLPAELSPAKLVLEAPFDSMANAIANHPFSYPFRVMPYFESYFVDPVRNSPELNFDSAARIVDIKSTQIMILHAEDDGIIPMKLGHNLYKTAAKSLGESRVKYVPISGSFGLGHKHICNHEKTMTLVKEFIDRSINLHNNSH